MLERSLLPQPTVPSWVIKQINLSWPQAFLSNATFDVSGQSLLLTTALNSEPPKKKLKSESSDSLVKKRSLWDSPHLQRSNDFFFLLSIDRNVKRSSKDYSAAVCFCFIRSEKIVPFAIFSSFEFRAFFVGTERPCVSPLPRFASFSSALKGGRRRRQIEY